MSYCKYCGREEIKGRCTCLKTNMVSKSEAWFLYIMIIVSSMVLFNLYPEGSIIRVGGNAVVFILLLITTFDMIFRRNYLALFFGCHQSSSRSFKIKNYVLPLCSRCTGIYFGIIIVAIISDYRIFPFYIYPILGLPLIIDGLLQKFGNIQSANPRRFITGLLFAAMFVFVFSYAQYALYWLGTEIYKSLASFF